MTGKEVALRMTLTRHSEGAEATEESISRLVDPSPSAQDDGKGVDSLLALRMTTYRSHSEGRRPEESIGGSFASLALRSG